MMDVNKVDLVIQYALARAAHGDKPWERELGPIHLLKFVYLADLAFAERNAGVTFTGADWAFYHYGPWAPAVLDRIRSVAPAIARETVYTSTRYENDATRWAIAEPEEADDIESAAERELPMLVVSAIRRAVKQFGTDTTELLHYVYSTAPMLHAAPDERLDFAFAARAMPALRVSEPSAPLSRKQEKKREEATRELQERARQKLAELRERRASKKPQRKPRYDAVFVQGQRWLDELGGRVEEEQGEVEFDDAVWKNPWRSDPGAA